MQLAKLFRNNNKNSFLLICCKFLANKSKSSEILKQLFNDGLIIENVDLSDIPAMRSEAPVHVQLHFHDI